MRDEATGRFLPGHSGNPAGKPKGSRNKYTKAMLTTAMQKLEEENVDPMNELLKLAMTTQDDKLKAKILTDILDYTNDKSYIETDDEGHDVFDYDPSTLDQQLRDVLS